MKRVAIIPHTADRLELLSALLDSAKRLGTLRGWEVVLVAQGYDQASSRALKSLPSIDVISHADITSAKLGPHNARARALRAHPADLYLSLDDDMEFLEDTDYSTLERFALQPEVGMIAGRWCARRAEVPEFRARRMDTVTRTALVATGGGLMFRTEVADVIRAMPDAPYLFDDVDWSLATYVEGFTNLWHNRVFALHFAAHSGGRRAWSPGAKRLPDPALLNTHRAAQSTVNKLVRDGLAAEYQVAWPLARDVTPLAHELHRKRRIERGL